MTNRIEYVSPKIVYMYTIIKWYIKNVTTSSFEYAEFYFIQRNVRLPTLHYKIFTQIAIINENFPIALLARYCIYICEIRTKLTMLHSA